MRGNKFIIGVMLVILLFASIQVQAGTGKRRGTAGAMELLIPVGSRGTALGGPFVAGISGVEAIYWNPAGVAAFDRRTQVMFSHLNWLAGIDVNYVAVASRLGTAGIFGFSLKSVSLGDIQETTIDNPDGTGRTFSPTFLTLGVTYSKAMTDRIYFGVNMKMISEKIMRESATGVAFDFGLQYVSDITGLKIGVVLANLGANMNFDGPDLEQVVQLPGTEAGSDEEALRTPLASFELPSMFQIGISYDLSLMENNKLTLMGNFQNNSFSFDRYHVAAEYCFNNMVFLRGGYSLAYREGVEGVSDGFVTSEEDYLFGPSFGAGVQYDVGANLRLGIDYAYRMTKFFDDNQWLSVTVGF